MVTAAVLLATLLAFYFVNRHFGLVPRLQFLYWQRQARLHRASPDTVAFGPGSSTTSSYVASRWLQSCWKVTTAYPRDLIPLFVGQRTSSRGQTMITSVGIEREGAAAGVMVLWVTATSPATITNPPRLLMHFTKGFLQTADLPLDRAILYWGHPDPQHANRIVIPFHLDDRCGDLTITLREREDGSLDHEVEIVEEYQGDGDMGSDGDRGVTTEIRSVGDTGSGGRVILLHLGRPNEAASAAVDEPTGVGVYVVARRLAVHGDWTSVERLAEAVHDAGLRACIYAGSAEESSGGGNGDQTPVQEHRRSATENGR